MGERQTKKSKQKEDTEGKGQKVHGLYRQAFT